MVVVENHTDGYGHDQLIMQIFLVLNERVSNKMIMHNCFENILTAKYQILQFLPQLYSYILYLRLYLFRLNYRSAEEL